MRTDVELPSTVTLVEGRGGLPMLRVVTEAAQADLYLHGAHLTRWVPAGHEPVLWLSDHSHFTADQAIRGGVPVCFPWFGPGRDGAHSPAHGFARLSTWQLVGVEDAGGVVTVRLRLTEADVAGRPGVEQWPHSFTAEYRISIGEELLLALTVRNTGSKAMSYEAALHTYLGVQDVTGVHLEGLERAMFWDKVTGEDAAVHEGPVTVTGQTDRIYRSPGPVTVHDPGHGRSITVAKRDSASTVVWNPWTDKAASMADFGDEEWRGMVCVETANVLDDAVHLPAGASHTMTARHVLPPG